MITQTLLFIKHNVPVIWMIVEKVNEILFAVFHNKKIISEQSKSFANYTLPGYEFRLFNENELVQLELLLKAQAPNRVKFFNPHGYDLNHLRKVYQSKPFLMMGVFKGNQLVGYFFLRCFWNKKCFVGRLIDEPYEGEGIGRIMNSIMYNTGWNAGFKVLSTISKNNKYVMRSHQKNNTMKVLKELKDDYLLVEFERNY